MSSLPTRRKFLQVSAAGAAAGALAIAIDGTVFEANRPRLISIEVPLPRLPESWDGFRIAQLSDFHYDDLFSVRPLGKAIDIVNGLQPDLIALTGDFVTAPWQRSPQVRARAAMTIEPCARLLGQLRAPAGVLAVLGNHDASTDPSEIGRVLEAHVISVLQNRSIEIERDGKRLWFAGVEDVLEGKADLKLALRGIPPAEPVILLAHEPDFADHVSRHPVDLQLSGHSHGGQIVVPFIGAPYLPSLGRKYPRGMHRIGPLTLYTNVGIGTVLLAMRFDCPPEITLITLRTAPGMASRVSR